MGYVIIRTDQRGGYVAPEGSHSSYTNDLRRARVWRTRVEAERHLCPESETVVPLHTLLPQPR